MLQPLARNVVYMFAEGSGKRTIKKNYRLTGDGPMNQTELNKYRAVLDAKKADLSAGLRNREDIAIEKTPDALDEVQLAGERELAIRNLDRESNLLRNVRTALARINDGSYGVCMHCEEDIKPKRLEAVPWAKYCIRCQEAADRHEFEAETGDVDELLLNAA
jgi:DnaK suppressor protein